MFYIIKNLIINNCIIIKKDACDTWKPRLRPWFLPLQLGYSGPSLFQPFWDPQELSQREPQEAPLELPNSWSWPHAIWASLQRNRRSCFKIALRWHLSWWSRRTKFSNRMQQLEILLQELERACRHYKLQYPSIGFTLCCSTRNRWLYKDYQGVQQLVVGSRLCPFLDIRLLQLCKVAHRGNWELL